MRFSVPDDHNFRLSHMDLLFAEFLKQIPREADPGSHRDAQDRLFTAPMENSGSAEDERILEDWKEYVTPELEHLFESARETVDKDLQNLERMTEEELAEVVEQTGMTDLPPLFTVDFPRAHRDAWLSALNQARLVLAEKYGWAHQDTDVEDEVDALGELLEAVEEEEEEDDEIRDPDQAPFAHRKRLALLQMHVYSMLQECLVEDFRRESGEDEPYATSEDLEGDEENDPDLDEDDEDEEDDDLDDLLFDEENDDDDDDDDDIPF